MTRVILTNKQTGQELPEAEVLYTTECYMDIRFDGTEAANTFTVDEWDVREVRTFRTGDVLRRKDRSNMLGFYVYTEAGWGFVNWGSEIAVAHTSAESLDHLFDSPAWELA